MPKIIDKSSLHHRILNRSKGEAVQGHRAQADRDLYQKLMVTYLQSLQNLDIMSDRYFTSQKLVLKI